MPVDETVVDVGAMIKAGIARALLYLNLTSAANKPHMSKASKKKFVQELTVFANCSPDELIDMMAKKNRTLLEMDKMKAYMDSLSVSDHGREERRIEKSKISGQTKYKSRA